MWGGTSFGALSGGVGAELSGGDFWRGAGVGATVSLLNHYMHQVEGDINQKRQVNKENIDQEIYTVKKGDNLWSIAQKEYEGKYSVGEFLFFNKNIEYGYDSKGNYVPLIYPGQEIKLPRYFIERPKQYSPLDKFKSAVEIIINISFDYFMKPPLGPVIPELMIDEQFDPNKMPDA